MNVEVEMTNLKQINAKTEQKREITFDRKYFCLMNKSKEI